MKLTHVVSVEWLQDHLHDKDLVLLDASPPADEGPDALTRTIPSARFFDLKNKFSDSSSALPNTFPSPEQFELECRKLGINSESRIVVFDNKGIYFSPRVWWMFKVMGHAQVSVLDGGLPEWTNKGFPTSGHRVEAIEPGNFKADFRKDAVKKFHDVERNVSNQTFTLIDARSEGRFNGIEEEPRPYLQSGHIPGSINIPFESVLSDGKFKPETELSGVFADRCHNGDQLVFTCGSGLTACIVLLACDMVFKESRFVYDGSWTEWAEKKNLIK